MPDFAVVSGRGWRLIWRWRPVRPDSYIWQPRNLRKKQFLQGWMRLWGFVYFPLSGGRPRNFSILSTDMAYLLTQHLFDLIVQAYIHGWGDLRGNLSKISSHILDDCTAGQDSDHFQMGWKGLMAVLALKRKRRTSIHHEQCLLGLGSAWQNSMTLVQL